MEVIIDITLILIYGAGCLCLPFLLLGLVADELDDHFKILTILFAIIWVVAYGCRHDNIRTTHTTNNEFVFEKNSHYHVKDPTYIIASTLDEQKYTSTDRENMEKVANLVLGKAIDKTKIENSTLQIYYSNGKRVDIKIKQLDNYYKKYD